MAKRAEDIPTRRRAVTHGTIDTATWWMGDLSTPLQSWRYVWLLPLVGLLLIGMAYGSEITTTGLATSLSWQYVHVLAICTVLSVPGGYFLDRRGTDVRPFALPLLIGLLAIGTIGGALIAWAGWGELIRGISFTLDLTVCVMAGLLYMMLAATISQFLLKAVIDHLVSQRDAIYQDEPPQYDDDRDA